LRGVPRRCCVLMGRREGVLGLGGGGGGGSDLPVDLGGVGHLDGLLDEAGDAAGLWEEGLDEEEGVLAVDEEKVLEAHLGEAHELALWGVGAGGGAVVALEGALEDAEGGYSPKDTADVALEGGGKSQ
jgi:hypothetical protein